MAGVHVAQGGEPRSSHRDDIGQRKPLRQINLANATCWAEVNVRKRAAQGPQGSNTPEGRRREKFDDVETARQRSHQLGGGCDARHERQLVSRGSVEQLGNSAGAQSKVGTERARTGQVAWSQQRADADDRFRDVLGDRSYSGGSLGKFIPEWIPGNA